MSYSADVNRTIEAVLRSAGHRALRQNWFTTVEARAGAGSPVEIEEWLTQNARKRYAISYGLYGFEDMIDATAFKLVFG